MEECNGETEKVIEHDKWWKKKFAACTNPHTHVTHAI